MSRTRIADIVALASRITGIATADIVGPTRVKRIVRVRAAVALVARKHGHSFPTIGARLGGRDHSSIVHYTQQEAMWRQYEPAFGELVDKLTETAASDDALFVSDGIPVPSAPAKPDPRLILIKPLPRVPVFRCKVKDPDHSHLSETAIANGSAKLAAAIARARAA